MIPDVMEEGEDNYVVMTIPLEVDSEDSLSDYGCMNMEESRALLLKSRDELIQSVPTVNVDKFLPLDDVEVVCTFFREFSEGSGYYYAIPVFANGEIHSYVCNTCY